jgi:uncharacterized protein
VQYRPRVADQLLTDRLTSAGAVVLEGPKACGKTWTARRFAASEVLLDVDPGARHALDADPALILDGAPPRLVDEWQIGGTPLWNHVRRAIDDRQSAGQFILTGSSTPTDDVTRHSGAGRFARIAMRPMSLYEIGDSTGDISVADLMAGEATSCPDPGLGVRDIINRISIGGWPSNLDSAVDSALQRNIDYLDHAREVDIPSISGPRRDPERLRRLLTSLARNTATEVKISALARETLGDNETALARTRTQTPLRRSFTCRRSTCQHPETAAGRSQFRWIPVRVPRSAGSAGIVVTPARNRGALPGQQRRRG